MNCITLKYLAIIWAISPDVDLHDYVPPAFYQELKIALKEVAEDANLQDIDEFGVDNTYIFVIKNRLKLSKNMPLESDGAFIPDDAFLLDTIKFQNEYIAYLESKKLTDWHYKEEYYDDVIKETTEIKNLYAAVRYTIMMFGNKTSQGWRHRYGRYMIMERHPEVFQYGLPAPLPLWSLRTVR